MERIKHLMKCIVSFSLQLLFPFGSFRNYVSAFKQFFAGRRVVYARICVAALTGQRAVITIQMKQLKIIKIVISKQTERMNERNEIQIFPVYTQ